MDIRALVRSHIAWNLVFATVWLYATGGTGSLFSFLYLLVIIESSALAGLKGTLVVTAASSLLYWLPVHLEWCGVLSPFHGSLREGMLAKNRYPLSLLVFTLSAMFLTALLASYSSEKIKRTGTILEATAKGIQDLKAIHEHIVRCIHSGLTTVSLDNRITSFNHAAERITGYKAYHMLGRPVEDIFGPFPQESYSSHEESGSTPLRWEQTFKNAEGKELPLGFSKAALRDHHGTELGHVFVFQDLTAYKQMEEELKRADRMAAIGELATGLAHEIRNPLASLYGSVEILNRELSLRETHKRLMDIILNESERLNELITDFLQFASPSMASKDSIPLKLLVEETLMLIQNGSQWRKDCHVVIDIPQGLCAYGNRKQLEQVLWNLLLNALDAMPHGGEILVSAREKKKRSPRCTSRNSEKAPMVEWSISDTGVGIPNEQVNKIFDPFFTTKEQGSGLGLAVVFRIIEKHGGTIRVKSTPGGGTTFLILLPLGKPV
jgi:two-component system sensor histidine kinase PilS (NtrC family)